MKTICALSLIFTCTVQTASAAAPASSASLLVTNLHGKLANAPHDANDARHTALCDGEGREPQSSEDKALATAGWIPFFAPQEFGTTHVVIAAASLDGQCLPKMLTVFVFRHGKAVGEVGSNEESTVPKVQLNDANTMIVSADYRKPSDPHCCPSGKAESTVVISDDSLTSK